MVNNNGWFAGGGDVIFRPQAFYRVPSQLFGRKMSLTVSGETALEDGRYG